MHFQCDRQILLLDLPLDLLKEGGLVHPVREDIVLQELLRDGAGSLREVPLHDPPVEGTRDSLRIDPEMLVEPFVLDRYDRLLQRFRHLGELYVDAVRFLAGECEDDIPVLVQHVGPVAVRLRVEDTDGWSPDDTVRGKNSSRCDDSQERNEHHSEKCSYFTSCHRSGPPFPARSVQITFSEKQARQLMKMKNAACANNLPGTSHKIHSSKRHLLRSQKRHGTKASWNKRSSRRIIPWELAASYSFLSSDCVQIVFAYYRFDYDLLRNMP